MLRLLATLALCASAAVAADDDIVLLCFGDGTGASCPCDNHAAAGRGCVNVSGAGAKLTATGDPNVNHDSLALHVEGLPPSSPGVLFSGDSVWQPTTFGNGLRCVGGTVRRLSVGFSDGAGQLQSMGNLSGAGGVVAGDVRYYQFWYRDVVGPCAAAFNATGACRVQW